MFFRFVCSLVVVWLISGSDAESCPELPPVDNSVFVAKEMKGQIWGAYFCLKGYHLVGERNLFCNASKEWNASIPKCRLGHCPDPVLVNGEVSALGPVNVSDKITLKCNEQYILKGSNWSQCGEDHTWVPPLPVCRSKHCGPPGYPADGYFEGSDFSSGSTITYKCEKGYRLVGTRDQQCIDGEWNSELPACELIQEPPKPALQIEYEKALLAFKESKELCKATENFMQRLKESGLTMEEVKIFLEVKKAELEAKMFS
ncbi:complement component 4 binding protein beta [Phyllostomus discolor]|uniref:C4b-binding protein beta chain isoform X1 n=1 Tax=Phyllostomus discolor TaxID=89673 RepID=A0A6J2N1T2_9CHIR|nr:C4b-binding protein beta chain isoform X1 [Phyllostomus discolor]XP_035871328.1 C4b-binding protein beta chain isoform X1 [Phyllostomus discolor]KAF6074079.1 complement component 4 binding protein beta [Phyllostomus discolor]